MTAQVLAGDLVRTQDRGRWSDGRLQVLGRIDDIVISGGENVDLGSAQRVSDAEFGPGAVVLLAVPDDRWGSRIVAVTTSGLGLNEVRGRLERVLGTAATPKELRQIPAVAYTSMGKIDRPALVRAWQREGEHGLSLIHI